MSENAEIQHILNAMRDDRFDPENQQYGVVVLDANTKPLVYSGKEINPWSGELIGEDFAVMGNILVGEAVISEAYRVFQENRNKSLAERLMLALKAGEQAGGDSRCGDQYARSAFLMIYGQENDAIFKLAIQGLDNGGKPAVALLNDQFEQWMKKEEE